MDDRSGDIEFDFFDEPATEEAARPRAATRGPRRPPRPPAGITPLLRLVGLIGFAIAVVVLLVFWAQGCRAESKRSRYETYMQDMQGVARDSSAVGKSLASQLTTRGIAQAELAKRVDGLVVRQQQGIDRAGAIDPPGRLRPEHRHAIEALQLRAGGLRLLAAALRRTANVKSAPSAANLLAQQAQRLLASDVVWEDLFRGPSLQELRRQGLLGIAVPESTFLTDTTLVTQRGMLPILQRIRGAATGGTAPGKHGNGIVSVRAEPGGDVLKAGAENTITATADLRFVVTIENSGDSQEVRVPVKLTIQQTPQPIVKTVTIDAIDPGEQKGVTFANLGEIVQFAQKTNVKVTVEKVPGEKNLDNNSAQYAVTFVLVQT